MLVKRFFACLLALALLVGMLSGCAAKPSETAAEPMVLFTDSLGRKVRVPASLTRVAPSGAVASMFLAVVALISLHNIFRQLDLKAAEAKQKAKAQKER